MEYVMDFAGNAKYKVVFNSDDIIYLNCESEAEARQQANSIAEDQDTYILSITMQ